MKKLVLVLMVLFSLTLTNKVFAVSVGLIGADDNLGYVTSYLTGTGMFSGITDSIKEIDARFQTPSLSTLNTFDSVLVWDNYVFLDRDALGNNLYDYVNAGGGVVLTNFAIDPNWGLGGNIMTQAGYNPLSTGPSAYTLASLGAYDSSSPIMAGVNSLTDIYRCVPASLNSGATLVASWDDGSVLAAWDFGGKVVGINMYPGVYRQATGDYAKLFGNALLFSAGEQQVSPVSPVPEPATLSLLGLGLAGLLFKKKKIV